MKTTLQLIVTFQVESESLKLADMDSVRGACGRAVEAALGQGIKHGLAGTTMALESVRPIVVHFSKVAKKKGNRP